MQCYSKIFYLKILYLIFLFEVLGSISILDKGITPLERDSIGMQFFIDIENKDRINSCEISTWAEDCCLTDDEEDCNTMQVYGGDYSLQPKDKETLIFIYPSLYQHDQVGYCNFVLEYKCDQRRSKRQNIKIPFDTKVTGSRKSYKLLKHYLGDSIKKNCETIDQDALNNCGPVNCDFKYGGERPFYDFETEKCTEASLCQSDPDEELPEVVYVPTTNTCRDLEHPLTVADIYAISTRTGVVTNPSGKQEVKLELKSNCSTISQNLNFLKDLMLGNLYRMPGTDTSDFSRCSKSAIMSILLYIIAICGLVLSFICCIHSLLWLHKKLQNKDISKFCQVLRGKIKKSKGSTQNYNVVNSEVRNNLLRDVIVKDIPVELRDSIVDICDRMEKHVKKKKRYRRADMGSQISLSKVEYDVLTTTTSSSTITIE